MVTVEEFKKRRQQFMDKLLPNSIAFIPSGKEVIRNGMDNTFPFRQSSDFMYLTGFMEPDAVLALAPGREEGEVILFNRPNDAVAEAWNGPRAGQEGACSDHGMDQAFPIEAFDDKLVDLLAGRQQVYYPIGRHLSFDHRFLRAYNVLRNHIRRGLEAPIQLMNVEIPLHTLRALKSKAELEFMRFANKISSEAHMLAMQACKPGMHEYELEAVLRSHCVAHNCREFAYPPIVGGGKNACTLHYVNNDKLISENELVLIDAGGEYFGYASDITRTFPANGKYSPDQRALYEVVLAAQNAVLEQVKVGLPWDTMQATTINVLTEGLVELGILSGNVDDLIEQKAYQAYYMHQISHWLGLDTHDVGAYRENGEAVKLQSNMVMTVEPGLYISAGSDCDERWWNMGVRIEDNVVVTDDGHENMTLVPKYVDEIEALMSL